MTPKARIGELLVQAKVITQAQLDLVLSLPRDRKIGQYLVEHGFVSEAALTQTLSLQLSVPWVALSHVDFARDLLDRVPEEIAVRYTLVPVFVRMEKRRGGPPQQTLYVALDDPTNELALTEIANVTGLPTRPMIASRSDILAAIRVYYRGEPADPAPPSSVIAGPEPSRPAVMPSRERDVPPTADPSRGREVGAPTSEPPPRTASAPPPRASSAEPIEESPLTLREEPPPSTRMIAMTLLDGTTVTLPARRRSERALPSIPRSWTTGDLINALRAAAEGKRMHEVLGEEPRWELLVSALLSLMIRKGVIADWEFVDELRKMSTSKSEPK